AVHGLRRHARGGPVLTDARSAPDSHIDVAHERRELIGHALAQQRRVLAHVAASRIEHRITVPEHRESIVEHDELLAQLLLHVGREQVDASGNDDSIADRPQQRSTNADPISSAPPCLDVRAHLVGEPLDRMSEVDLTGPDLHDHARQYPREHAIETSARCQLTDDLVSLAMGTRRTALVVCAAVGALVLGACSSDAKTSTTTTGLSGSTATTATTAVGGSTATTATTPATQTTLAQTSSTLPTATTAAPAVSTSTTAVTKGRVVTSPSDNVKKGDTGDGVKQIQTALKNKGYKVTVDGDFGQQTDTAVKAFQKKSGLKQDGIVGPKTWAKLSAAGTTTTTTGSTATTSAATTTTKA
ncbi:MAG: Peptidoglycan-binding domain 1 protein, partial [Ilumatobacteraceae bacterium]|nr:Peptidoglycan-binding domain 1 protein [Ilumatobacteraceae bacterium]